MADKRMSVGASGQGLAESSEFKMGQFLLDQARQKKAAQELKAAVELYNKAKDSFRQVAKGYCAISFFSKTIGRLNPQTVTNEALRTCFAKVYFERGEALQGLGQSDKAQASYQKAKKWEHPKTEYKPDAASPVQKSIGTSSLEQSLKVSADIAMAPAYPHLSLQFFLRDPPPRRMEHTLPSAGSRFNDTQQLAYCLALLSLDQVEQTNVALNPDDSTWLKDISDHHPEEPERLHGLAVEVLRAFTADEFKDTALVAEVVVLAPTFKKETFRTLLETLIRGIDKGRLLNFDLLDGLSKTIRSAAPNHLQADDLVKILKILSAKLQETHSQGTKNLYQLTFTVSHVLDAMADSHVEGLNREELHAPLLGYLKKLQDHHDPHLVYQAAYACQALTYVPDDETPWQGALRRTGSIVRGVAGLVSAVKAVDLNQLLAGFKDIQEGIRNAEIFKPAVDAYKEIKSLAESGQKFADCLKEGLSFNNRKQWYRALRGADVLLQNNQLTDFERLVCQVPCNRHKAFLWGLSERLGQLAANPQLEEVTHRGALRFLGKLYTDDDTWGQEIIVKQRIIEILVTLAHDSPVSQEATTLLTDLSQDGAADKQALYQVCRGKGPSTYPLTVAPPSPTSFSLLDRVQNRQKVEPDLSKIKNRRIDAFKETIYIPPLGKASVRAEETFDLEEKVNEFLASDQKVLLLLGDSGSGKSTFDCFLARRLWEAYQPNGRIPLWIYLPGLDHPEDDLITKQLRREGFSEPQIRELKDHRSFVFICDGYDESQQTENLYMSNRLNQGGEWQGQMVISCRTEYLPADYQDYFQPIDRNRRGISPLFQEMVVAPFSENEIDAYMQKYVENQKSPWSVEKYQETLEEIPHLNELVSNPFLLGLVLEVLPSLVSLEKNRLTSQSLRVMLYDQFVEQWFERSKKRLVEQNLTGHKKKTFKLLTDEGFTPRGIAFAKSLAVSLYEKNNGNPVVKYTYSKDRKSWKEAFFSQEDDEQLLLREASPLARTGNQYRFIHKSVLEYFIARAVFEPQDGTDTLTEETESTQTRRKNVSSSLSSGIQSSDEPMVAIDQALLDSPLARMKFIGEPAILQFLAERVQKEQLFKQQLLTVIERSKTEKSACIAAANAITILVRANVQWNGVDLRNIQIPGADLSYGVFDCTQLQGADLRRVNFRTAWLRSANLNGARMSGVQFGEWPFLEEDSGVIACAYSPNGESLAVGLENGKISLYDTSNWEKRQTLYGHTGWVRSVAYSPNGQQIASGSLDMTVRLWDVQSGHPGHVLSGHTGEVHSVAYSPNGQQIASGSWDKTVRLWNVQTGHPGHVLNGHTDYVRSVAYSPNGQQIASGSSDSTVRLWDVQTGHPGHVLNEHLDSVFSVAYSPNGQQVASGSGDNTMRLWDVETGHPGHILDGHTDSVLSVAHSPNGQQIASGSDDRTVRLWDVQSGRPGHVLNGHTDEVNSVAYSPNGQQIASGSWDSTVRLWDVQTGRPGHVLNGHTDWVNSVAHSPNGQQIASGSGDYTVRLWDVQTSHPGHVLRGHRSSVSSVAYSPDGQQIASGSWDSTGRLWDVQTGRPGHVLNGHTSIVWSVAYSPNGQQIASGSDDKTVRLWDVKTGHPGHVLNGHTGQVISVAYSPNGQQIASGSNDKTVRLWDVQTGHPGHTLSGHTSSVNSVAYSPNGQQIASGSYDKTVKLWNVQTGHPGHTLSGHTSSVNSVAYSPNGQQIASGSGDMTVRLWDVASGQCRAVIRGFHGSVYSVAWGNTPDSNYLVTGSEDTSVRLWEVIEDGHQCQVLLRWSSTHAELTVFDTSIQDVQDLSPMNQRLLKQRGAVGEPLLHSHKTIETVTNQPSDLEALSGTSIPLAEQHTESEPLQTEPSVRSHPPRG